uniref:Uncharacterized protein n=1 Tax=Mustela putorius furo TaxID=9669 RepID=M3YNL3_MUSPF
ARYHNTASGPSPPGHLLASQAPPCSSLQGSSEHPTKSQSGDLHLGPEGPCLPTEGGQSGWAYQAGQQCGKPAAWLPVTLWRAPYGKELTPPTCSKRGLEA